MLVLVFIAVVASLSLNSCSMPRNVLPVVKIGMVAPFEGPQRTEAYDALSTVKAAIQDYNDANRESGPMVELVALNDNGWVEEARRQALQMAADPAILGVIGPWSAESAAAGNDVYVDAGLAVVYPAITTSIGPTPSQAPTRDQSTSTAHLVSDAADLLLEAIHEVAADADLTREDVLRQIQTRHTPVRVTSPMGTD